MPALARGLPLLLCSAAVQAAPLHWESFLSPGRAARAPEVILPSALQLQLSPALSGSAPPAPPAPADPQALIADLSINGQPRGERILFRHYDRYLLRKAELAELLPLPPDLPSLLIEGETFAALNDLPGAELSFDESNLALALMLPPEAFARQQYSLSGSRGAVRPPPREASAVLNYRLSYSDVDAGGAGQWSLAAEQALSRGGWLLRNQSFHLSGAGTRRSLRQETQLIHDDREHLRRLVIGDSFTAGSALAPSFQLGGLSWVKDYRLNPYFQARPSVNFAGAVPLPSQVEFYLGGNRVFSQTVAPGPFEIRDFNYYGGQRDLRVVIRDPLGREQTIAYPFYFTDQGLAAGLHDYGYHLGFLRENFGLRSDDYGARVWSAAHRYGFTDWLTAGLRADGGDGGSSGGLNLTLRSDYLGLLALEGGYGRATHTQHSGSALSAMHSFQTGEFFSQMAWRRSGPSWLPQLPDEPELPRTVFNASLGYAPRWLGALSVGYERSSTLGRAPARTLTLGYSRPLPGAFSLLANVRRGLDEDGSEALFVALLYLPTSGHSASASMQRSAEQVSNQQLQYSSPIPLSEGLGYRVALARNQDGPQTLETVAPELLYNTRYQSFSAQALTQSGTGGSTSYQLAAAGGVALIGGQLGFSRPVNDAVGLAVIEPPLAGVRVYQSNQEVGRTDEKGRLFLPALVSSIDNYVTLDDRDIPIDYSLARVDQTVAPNFRGGALLRFALTRRQSLTGTLLRRVDGALLPLGYHAAQVLAAGAEQEFMTGSKGEFYLENLAAGHHAAAVTVDGRACRFELRVPASAESHVELGEVVACDAP